MSVEHSGGRNPNIAPATAGSIPVTEIKVTGADVVTRLAPRPYGSPATKSLTTEPGPQGYLRDAGDEIPTDSAPTIKIPRNSQPLNNPPVSSPVHDVVPVVATPLLEVPPVVDVKPLSLVSPDTSTVLPIAQPEGSRVKRWARTISEKAGWYAVTYASGYAAIPASNYLVDGRNDALVTSTSAALYGAMGVALLAVGERIIRRQTTRGSSPSVGAMIGYEHATNQTTNQKDITKKTAIGYLAEQALEELPILTPAIEIAATQGVKPALIFLGGTAIPTLGARIAQYHSLHKYSGEPIFFPKTRERLQTKERLHNAKTKATEIFHRDRHLPAA